MSAFQSCIAITIGVVSFLVIVLATFVAGFLAGQLNAEGANSLRGFWRNLWRY